MKFLLVSFVLLFGCQPEVSIPITDVRTTQGKRLDAFLGEYGNDYSKAINEIQKSEVNAAYQRKLHTYLKDSLKGVIEPVRVKVEALSTLFDNKAVHVRMVRGKVSFDYVISVKDDTASYNFLKGLPVGTDTVCKFRYMGECKVEYGYLIEISAYPLPTK